MFAARLGLALSALLLSEDVELKTEDGVRIAAAYTKPEARGKRPALLLVHMLGRKKEDWNAFAEAASKAGYAVLAIDMRGHGKSENPFEKDREKKSIEKWDKEEWMNVLKDLKAAKAFLAGKEEVDPKKIVLIGASIGANLSLQFAAANPEVRAVAALSPGENYRGVSSGEAIDKCAGRPFFAAASEDDRRSARAAKSLADRVKHQVKNVRIYQTAGHGTDMFGREDKPGDLKTSLLEWLDYATR